uniref:Uncharacterized protein n=1 Tax=Leersia perrieri TaxID=77586 RepID=A0A0D9W096_9ORYZ
MLASIENCERIRGQKENPSPFNHLFLDSLGCTQFFIEKGRHVRFGEKRTFSSGPSLSSDRIHKRWSKTGGNPAHVYSSISSRKMGVDSRWRQTRATRLCPFAVNTAASIMLCSAI